MKTALDLLTQTHTPTFLCREGQPAALDMGLCSWALAGCTVFFPGVWEALRSVGASGGCCRKTPHPSCQAPHICITLRTPPAFQLPVQQGGTRTLRGEGPGRPWTRAFPGWVGMEVADLVTDTWFGQQCGLGDPGRRCSCLSQAILILLHLFHLSWGPH